jgi:hypothetical protein
VRDSDATTPGIGDIRHHGSILSHPAVAMQGAAVGGGVSRDDQFDPVLI